MGLGLLLATASLLPEARLLTLAQPDVRLREWTGPGQLATGTAHPIRRQPGADHHEPDG
jgi:hypothetical protein